METRIDWLDALEEKVHEATERLRALAEENRAQARRIAELEGELAGAADNAGSSGEEGAAEWQRERDEIRQRVERLARGLGELIAE